MESFYRSGTLNLLVAMMYSIEEFLQEVYPFDRIIETVEDTMVSRFNVITTNATND